MKDLSPDDRPREKLLRHGAAALGDNELVAVVLGSGRAKAGVLDVANDVLRARGGLHGLARSSCGDLAQVSGIGLAKGAKLVAAQELGRRTLAVAPPARIRVATPRDVFREAMLGAAAAIVVFHNHPSGDPSPSPDDIALTRRLAAVGELIGIPVVDHIVLGDAKYCSLKELGQL